MDIHKLHANTEAICGWQAPQGWLAHVAATWACHLRKSSADLTQHHPSLARKTVSVCEATETALECRKWIYLRRISSGAKQTKRHYRFWKNRHCTFPAWSCPVGSHQRQRSWLLHEKNVRCPSETRMSLPTFGRPCHTGPKISHPIAASRETDSNIHYSPCSMCHNSHPNLHQFQLQVPEAQGSGWCPRCAQKFYSPNKLKTIKRIRQTTNGHNK